MYQQQVGNILETTFVVDDGKNQVVRFNRRVSFSLAVARLAVKLGATLEDIEQRAVDMVELMRGWEPTAKELTFHVPEAVGQGARFHALRVYMLTLDPHPSYSGGLVVIDLATAANNEANDQDLEKRHA